MQISPRRITVAAIAAVLAGAAAVAVTATPSSAAGTNAPTNHAYTATSFYIPMGPAQRKVVAVNVPAGSYTVAVRLNPFNGVGVDQFSCGLLEPSGGLVDNAFMSVDATNGFASTTMSLLGAVTTASAGTFAVKCSDGTAHGQMGVNTIVATEVGSVDQQR
jgi:hypothetical protein